MRYLKKYKLYEYLSFDIKDIDDMFIELTESGYMYHVTLDWYSELRTQGVVINIWKKGNNITSEDRNFIREDLYRLVDFMKSNGYNIISTYPVRLIKDIDKSSKRPIDKLELVFRNLN